MTHTALLRRIGAFHPGRLSASFGSIPFDLFGDVCESGFIDTGYWAGYPAGVLTDKSH